MNAQRKALESEYKKAIDAMNIAACGNDLSAFEACEAKVIELRKQVISFEEMYPTKNEAKRDREYRKLKSRGYDI